MMHRPNARVVARATATFLLSILATTAVVSGSGGSTLVRSLGQATPVASPVASEAVEFSGLLDRPGSLTVADLRAFPSETVEVTYETRGGPERHSFTGTRLFGVLDSLGFSTGADERNPLLTRYIVVTANDGYRVVLSGGELDPGFGNAPMLLAWEQDGAPLIGDDGPIRLVTPDDARGGRYVHGVVRIEVVGLPA